MKPVKPMLGAAVLSLALSISALAGEIQSPGHTAPPPPPPATCSNCDSSDEILLQTSDASSAETSEFAVDLLLAMLSFF